MSSQSYSQVTSSTLKTPPTRSTIAVVCGVYVLIGGAVSFGGWILDRPRLADWFDTHVSIQPNTAVLLMLTAAAVILLQFGRTWLALGFSAVVAIMGVLTLTQYLVGADFGFNHQLTFDRSWGGYGTLTRGRMGPPAATSFTLIGTSLLILTLSQCGVRKAIALRRWAPVAGQIVCTFMLFSLIGYLFGAQRFYTVPWLTAIALQTSSMLMALGIAVIVIAPDQQPLRLLRENSNTAMLARFVVPLLIVFPITVSWLRATGQELELYDEGTGRALAVIALIIIPVSLMWRALLILSVREHREIESAERLRESESRLRSIIEQLPVGVGVFNAAGSSTLTNSIMEQYVPDALPSTVAGASNRWRAWDENGHPIPAENWPGNCALRGETVLPGLEMLYTQDNGREIWMRVSAAPLRNSAGKIIGATCVVQDIDLPKRFRAQLEQELEQRTRELVDANERARRAEAMAILGTLSSGIAHDLGNLLLPLRTRLHLFKRTELNSGQREYLEAIDKSVGYIADLATRLRSSLSHLSSDNPSARSHTVASVNLAEWCRRTELFLRGVVPSSITLQCDIPSELPSLDLEEVGLTQAVYNLIQNSVKAIHTSGVGSRITLRARRCGDTIEVAIDDNGPGMTSEALHRCTEPAFTTDPGRSMGLGLSLIRTFVESASGSMRITSPSQNVSASGGNASSGPGTTVTLYFPLKNVHAHSHGIPMVACADDSQDILDLLRASFGALGSAKCAATFTDAQSLLNWLQQLPCDRMPDAIVMDWNMPGLPTCEAIRLIRERWPQVIVMVYTSHMASQLQPVAEQAGAHDVIEKNQGVAVLMDALRRCIDENQMKQALAARN